MTHSSADIRIVSTDFDGTIHEDFAHAPIPDLFQDRILEFQRRSGVWVINTGRHLASLLESLGRAKSRVLPDFVVTVEREIHRHVRGHYEAVEPWHTACQDDHREVFGRNESALRALFTGLESRFDATFYADEWSPLCVIARSNAQMDAIQDELEGFCRSVEEMVPVRNDVYLRLSHRGYSKGTALQEIQRLTNLSAAQTCAAGDHLNDLPMLRREVAHWLITPSNGLPSVKDQVRAEGGYLARTPCAAGILEGLEAFGMFR